MSMFDWTTAGFPNPTQDISAGVKPTVIRTEMDSGRVRQRKRFTSAIRTVPVRWTLTDAQWALFQGILEYKLNQGADWFTITLPTGNGMQSCTARFVSGSWNAKHVPVMYWDVTATLEVQGGSPLTEDEVDAILTPPTP